MGCQAYFFLLSWFPDPTFHVEAIASKHLSLSLLSVTLVHQPRPWWWWSLPRSAKLLSSTFPLLCFASHSVSTPMWNFAFHCQLLVLASELSLLELVGDSLVFTLFNPY